MKLFAHALAISLTLSASQSVAQIPRYELGKRVKRFERQFELIVADESARQEPLPDLKSAVSAFFTLQAAEALSHLDRATLALKKDSTIAPAVLAMTFEPQQRLLSPEVTELVIRIRPMYGERPAVESNVVLRLVAPDGKEVASQSSTTNAGEVTLKFQKLPEADYTLSTRIGEVELSAMSQTISVVKDLDSRLASVEAAAGKNDPDRTLPLGKYVREWGRQLRSLKRKTKPETDIPGHRLLARLEAWTTASKPVLDASVSRMVLSSGRKAVACRVRLCDAALKGKPRPVVIALHGAGGSENMFYETYGAGKVVGLCGKRDWLLVCPRISPLFGLPLGTDPMLSSLEAQGVSIDRKKVFVVGHSMGAGTAMSLARQETPLRAVAALGGGGSAAISQQNKNAPFFVAAGDQDFGLRGASSLASGLKKRGVKARFETYKNTEHLGIVQVALEDVFRFFDSESE